MTYCVGIMLRQGLIMIADTRTNAGIDNISTYRKLHVLADTKDSYVVAASAGNLSVTQLVLLEFHNCWTTQEKYPTTENSCCMAVFGKAKKLASSPTGSALPVLRSALKNSAAVEPKD